MGKGALWFVTVVEFLLMGIAGFSKFGDAEMWQGEFVGWGYPMWFASVIGAGELLGAILLLVPRFAFYSAALLAVIMLGALATVIIHDSHLGTTGPLIHLAFITLIAVFRFKNRWRPEATRTR